MGDDVYYIALETFKGTEDIFWRTEIYLIEEIINNGFTVDGLLEEGKIRFWQDGEEE
jgi:hypothetical protein